MSLTLGQFVINWGLTRKLPKITEKVWLLQGQNVMLFNFAAWHCRHQSSTYRQLYCMNVFNIVRYIMQASGLWLLSKINSVSGFLIGLIQIILFCDWFKRKKQNNLPVSSWDKWMKHIFSATEMRQTFLAFWDVFTL